MPHASTPRLALAVACLLLGAAGARAEMADKWPVARGPSREPNPYKHDPALVKTVPRPFLEDASACTLYYGTTHLIDPDGTVETVSHEVTRLNGRKGIERLGEYRSITFDPSYQKLTLNEARVLKADGRVVPIQPRHLQLRDLSTDYQVYDPEKQLVISFPNLEVGDTIEVRWTTRGKSPEFDGRFFTRYNFGDDQVPLVREEVRVRLPKSMPFKFATVNEKLVPLVREEGNDRFYQWTSLNRPPLPQDGELPSKELLRTALSLSTYPSWEEVAKWKEKLRAHCWKCTPEVRKVMLEVTKDLKTPLEKARALATWVRKHIRYVSVPGGRHGYTPQQPAQALANLFGDCKDQAQLLAVMLREAGLEVHLVTLGVQDDGQILPEVPSPWGTHAILLVRIDRREHWIDTTATNSAWDFLPPEARDRVCYVTRDGKIQLLRTPPLTCEENRFQQTTRVWVRPDGGTFCRRVASYHSQAAVVRRGAWLESPLGDRRRQMAAALQDANSRTRLRSLKVLEETLTDREKPVRALIEYDTPGHFSGSSDREGSFTDSNVWNRLLAYTLDHDRKVALELGRPFESVHRYLIQLPPAYRFDGAPAERHIRSKWASFLLRVKTYPKDPRSLELTFHTRVEKTRIDPADFAEYRKFHEELTKDWRVWVNLTPTQDVADAPRLELWLWLSPGDRDTAAVLARLYELDDRRADARRVLGLARACHPQDAKLWELTVKAAADSAEEESAYQEMVRLFPKESKYALALGEVRVRRGDSAGAKAVLVPLSEKGAAAVRGAAHYQLARVCLLGKDSAAALKHLQAAREADAASVGSVAALQFEGEVHERLGQTDEALAAYRKALKRDGEADVALAALVRLELATGRQAEALTDLRRYTVLVGDDHAGLVQAAAWHLQLGRDGDAFELATRAYKQKINPQSARVLGLVHLKRGEHARAVFYLDRAEPDSEVSLGLIRGHLALGRVREALAAAALAGKVAEPSEALKRARAQLADLAGRRKALLQGAGAALEKSVPWAVAVDAFLAADLAYREGAPAAHVERLVAGAFVIGVDLGPAYALRGLLALERGRLSKALADADRAIGLSPTEARAYLVRGRVRLERLHKDALADLARAAELSGRGDGAILHWLATAQFQVGLREQALATQREAVRLRPGDAEAAEQLRHFEQAAGVGQPARSSQGE
jgi:tetratricopeptide (TPR) repeat protein/transglutaminase-like putative cysteine protease